MRQGCVMPPWLFDIVMDECMRQIKAKVRNVCAILKINEWIAQWWHACLQDTVLFAKSEELQRVVDAFYSVCRRKL